jgi:2-polyprenyl-3-methyl-5-hydroxy-6-metoxy-1,4-benzoquinol methylase
MEDQYIPVQELLDHKYQNCGNGMRLLEAGCGSCSCFSFSEHVHITGIDISELQLLRNDSIDHRIVGDIQYYDFPPSSFDVIICWNVLEHVPYPQLALQKFLQAAKPEGIIVLGLPNLLSMKGLLTKYTPHIFHVWVYRYLFGQSNAGKHDTAPFKTVLSYSITPNAIRKFARQNNMEVVYFSLYEHSYYAEKLGLFFLRMKKLTTLLTFGVLGNSDFVIVLQKQTCQS